MSIISKIRQSLPVPSEKERADLLKMIGGIGERSKLIRIHARTICRVQLFETLDGGMMKSIDSPSNCFTPMNMFLSLSCISTENQKHMRNRVRRYIPSFEIYQEVTEFSLSLLGVNSLTHEAIFDKLFLPNTKIFDGLQNEVKVGIMCSLLSEKGSYWISSFVRSRPRFSGLKCVNTTRGWKTLSESLDGSIYLKFLGNEGSYVKGRMKRHVSILNCISDFKNIQIDQFCRVFKIIAAKGNAELSLLWLRHVERNSVILFSHLKLVENEIKSIKFIPAREYDLFGTPKKDEELRLAKISEVIHPKFASVCSSQIYMIDERLLRECPEVCTFFKLTERKKPYTETVYNHLLKISRHFQSASQERKEEIEMRLHPILQKIYKFFCGEKVRPEFLTKNAKWIWTSNGFSETETTSVYRVSGLDSSIEHLNFVPKVYRCYKEMFILFGVKKSFSMDDLLNVYDCELCSNFKQGERIEEGKLKVMIGILRAVEELVETRFSREKSGVSEKLKRRVAFLPSMEGTLESKEDLVANDIFFLEINDKSTKFVHEKIPMKILTKYLGVKSRAMMELKIEEKKITIYDSSKSVKLKITKFLRDFLDSNPEGDGILSEILQNADDAGAERIVIMYDENGAGTGHDGSVEQTRTLPGYRGLGESVLIFNDATFTEDDFEGIQNPLCSSKQLDCSKTGKFGKGISVLFHLGDSFELISGEKYCIMDPIKETFNSIRFLEHPQTITKCVDQFIHPFERFEGGIDYSREYPHTVFRIPVRRKKSEIKTTKYNVRDFLKMVCSFQSNKKAEACLLFLKSVRSLKIQHLQKGEKKPLTLLKVEKEGGMKYTSKIRELVSYKNKLMLEGRREISDNNNRKNMENPEMDQVKIRINFKSGSESSSLQKRSCWNVSYYVSSEHHMMDDPKKLPIGGVANLIHDEEEDCAVTGMKELKEIEGRVFNTLMMKQRTGLPVHINGDFEIQNNRSRLMSSTDCTGEEEQKRYSWNVKFFELIIFRCIESSFVDMKKRGLVKLLYSSYPDPEESVNAASGIIDEEEIEGEEEEEDDYNFLKMSRFDMGLKRIRQTAKDQFAKELHQHLFEYVLKNEFFFSSDGSFKKIGDVRDITRIDPQFGFLKKFLERTSYPNALRYGEKLRTCYKEKVKPFTEEDLVKHLFHLQKQRLLSSGTAEERTSLYDYDEKYISSSSELVKIFRYLIHQNKVKVEDLVGLPILPVDSKQMKVYVKGMDPIFIDRGGVIKSKKWLPERFLDQGIFPVLEFWRKMGVRELGIYDLKIFHSFFIQWKRRQVVSIWKFFEKHVSKINSWKEFSKFFGDWKIVPVKIGKSLIFYPLSNINLCLTPHKRGRYLHWNSKKDININDIAMKLDIPLVQLFEIEWGVCGDFRGKLKFLDFNPSNLLDLLRNKVEIFNKKTNRKERKKMRKFILDCGVDRKTFSISAISVLRKLKIFQMDFDDSFVSLDSGSAWKIVPFGCPAKLSGEYLKSVSGNYAEESMESLGVREVNVFDIYRYFSENNAKKYHEINDMNNQVKLLRYIEQGIVKHRRGYARRVVEYPIKEIEEWKIIRNQLGQPITVPQCIVTRDRVILKIFSNHPDIIPEEYLSNEEFMKFVRSHFNISYFRVEVKLYVSSVEYLLSNSCRKRKDFRQLCSGMIRILSKKWGDYKRYNPSEYSQILNMPFVPCVLGYEGVVFSSFRECCHPDDILLVRGVKPVICKEVVKMISTDMSQALELKNPDFETVVCRLEIVKVYFGDEEAKKKVSLPSRFLEKMDEKEGKDSMDEIYKFLSMLLKTRNKTKLEKLKEMKCIQISPVKGVQGVSFAVPKETYFFDPHKSSLAKKMFKVSERFLGFLPLFKFLGMVEMLPDTVKMDVEVENMKIRLESFSSCFSCYTGGNSFSSAHRPASSPKAKAWIKQAKVMLESCGVLFREGIYTQTCFYAQQTVEMSLKAVCHQIGKFSDLDEKQHNFLDHKVPSGLRKRISDGMSVMNQYGSSSIYIMTRYVKNGRLPSEKFGQYEAKALLKASSLVFEECEKEIPM